MSNDVKDNEITREKAQNKRQFVLYGEVVSDKADKTVVVKVVTAKRHPKYYKQYSVSKRYLAHDANNEFKTGDMVEIAESRPISRKKRWKVIRRIK